MKDLLQKNHNNTINYSIEDSELKIDVRIAKNKHLTSLELSQIGLVTKTRHEFIQHEDVLSNNQKLFLVLSSLFCFFAPVYIVGNSESSIRVGIGLVSVFLAVIIFAIFIIYEIVFSKVRMLSVRLTSGVILSFYYRENDVREVDSFLDTLVETLDKTNKLQGKQSE